jgi:hypothetical protein
MARYPTIFGLRDVVQGEGYIAGVELQGRALMHEEGDDYVWIEGVNPGGFTGTGHSPTEALEDFRKAYTAILYDIALEARTFRDFKSEVEALLANAGELPQREWEEAVQDVRTGRVRADWLGKRSAETPLGIRVAELKKPSAKQNKVEEGSALAA